MPLRVTGPGAGRARTPTTAAEHAPRARSLIVTAQNPFVLGYQLAFSLHLESLIALQPLNSMADSQTSLAINPNSAPPRYESEALVRLLAPRSTDTPTTRNFIHVVHEVVDEIGNPATPRQGGPSPQTPRKNIGGGMEAMINGTASSSSHASFTRLPTRQSLAPMLPANPDISVLSAVEKGFGFCDQFRFNAIWAPIIQIQFYYSMTDFFKSAASESRVITESGLRLRPMAQDLNRHPGGCLFEIPDQLATPRTTYRELKRMQQQADELSQTNKELTAQLAAATNQPGGGRRKKRGKLAAADAPNPLNFQDSILKVAKSFTVLVYPWPRTEHFKELGDAPLVPGADVWKPGASQKLDHYLTAAIYAHVPNKFHELIPSLPAYADSFCQVASAQRSTARNTLNHQLAGLLHDQNIIKDLNDASAWAALLLSSDDKDRGLKISPYPPIMYRNLQKRPTGFFMNKIGPMSLRGLLFGPASLGNGGAQKPQGSTLGKIWALKEISLSAMCFVYVLLIFNIYWAKREGKENFDEVGSVSQINFRDMYLRARWALESPTVQPYLPAIKKFWHEVVFKNVPSVPKLPESVATATNLDEEAELEEALGRLDMGIDEGEENGYHDFFHGDADYAARQVSAEHIRPAAAQAPGLAARPPARPLVPPAPNLAPAPATGHVARSKGAKSAAPKNQTQRAVPSPADKNAGASRDRVAEASARCQQRPVLSESDVESEDSSDLTEYEYAVDDQDGRLKYRKGKGGDHQTDEEDDEEGDEEGDGWSDLGESLYSEGTPAKAPRTSAKAQVSFNEEDNQLPSPPPAVKMLAGSISKILRLKKKNRYCLRLSTFKRSRKKRPSAPQVMVQLQVGTKADVAGDKALLRARSLRVVRARPKTLRTALQRTLVGGSPVAKVPSVDRLKVSQFLEYYAQNNGISGPKESHKRTSASLRFLASRSSVRIPVGTQKKTKI
ncbi:hypothetical protein K438DRAFT_1753702 [Mycena galopus ATCC 62051]|nr:hypothetical protein K438DRAFT_1753702 [Mycena galopus ATCC 62051]